MEAEVHQLRTQYSVLEALFKQHINECSLDRVATARRFEEIWAAFKEIRASITSMDNRVWALLVLIALGTGASILIQLVMS